MLVLNAEDMAAAVSCKEVIDAMEAAVLRAGRGEFETPLRTQVMNQGIPFYSCQCSGNISFPQK